MLRCDASAGKGWPSASLPLPPPPTSQDSLLALLAGPCCRCACAPAGHRAQASPNEGCPPDALVLPGGRRRRLQPTNARPAWPAPSEAWLCAWDCAVAFPWLFLPLPMLPVPAPHAADSTTKAAAGWCRRCCLWRTGPGGCCWAATGSRCAVSALHAWCACKGLQGGRAPTPPPAFLRRCALAAPAHLASAALRLPWHLPHPRTHSLIRAALSAAPPGGAGAGLQANLVLLGFEGRMVQLFGRDWARILAAGGPRPARLRPAPAARKGPAGAAAGEGAAPGPKHARRSRGGVPSSQGAAGGGGGGEGAAGRAGAAAAARAAAGAWRARAWRRGWGRRGLAAGGAGPAQPCPGSAAAAAAGRGALQAAAADAGGPEALRAAARGDCRCRSCGCAAAARPCPSPCSALTPAPALARPATPAPALSARAPAAGPRQAAAHARPRPARPQPAPGLPLWLKGKAGPARLATLPPPDATEC